MSKYRSPAQLKKYKKICSEIWEERGGICEKCKCYLGEATYYNFHHTKGRTKNLLNKDTILLLCPTHHDAEHGIKRINH